MKKSVVEIKNIPYLVVMVIKSINKRIYAFMDQCLEFQL